MRAETHPQSSELASFVAVYAGFDASSMPRGPAPLGTTRQVAGVFRRRRHDDHSSGHATSNDSAITLTSSDEIAVLAGSATGRRAIHRRKTPPTYAERAKAPAGGTGASTSSRVATMSDTVATWSLRPSWSGRCSWWPWRWSLRPWGRPSRRLPPCSSPFRRRARGAWRRSRSCGR